MLHKLDDGSYTLGDIIYTMAQAVRKELAIDEIKKQPFYEGKDNG